MTFWKKNKVIIGKHWLVDGFMQLRLQFIMSKMENREESTAVYRTAETNMRIITHPCTLVNDRGAQLLGGEVGNRNEG